MKTNKKNWNLKTLAERINRNIVISFFAMFLIFFAIMGIIYKNHKKNELDLTQQKLVSTFKNFEHETASGLNLITSTPFFISHLHSGWLSRDITYNKFLSHIKKYESTLSGVVGMEVYKHANNETLFYYGTKTKNWVTIKLCYLGGRNFLDFNVGECTYRWRIYYDKNTLIKTLKKLNPEIVDCKRCSTNIISSKYFAHFPIDSFSGMEFSLGIKQSSTITLWIILFSMLTILFMLATWNINRIKKLFKKLLSDPILDITQSIKNNTIIPKTELKELKYLIEQIALWKTQTKELETVKANEKLKEEKLKITELIGASVAHEIRTPVRSIISGASGINKFLPKLLENYEIAKKAGIHTKNIKPQQIQLLQKVLNNLQTEGTSINNIIDMLLMKIQGTIPTNSIIEELQIGDCVTEALHRYGFQNGERDLINYNTDNNFKFKGDKILTIHIIFNLLKNALYYLAKAKKGVITIDLEHCENENILRFKDTATGISKKDLPHIFERFYSKTRKGSGVGLAFCKMAMKWMKGDITCNSIEGKYTEFTLHFPHIKKKKDK